MAADVKAVVEEVCEANREQLIAAMEFRPTTSTWSLACHLPDFPREMPNLLLHNLPTGDHTDTNPGATTTFSASSTSSFVASSSSSTSTSASAP